MLGPVCLAVVTAVFIAMVVGFGMTSFHNFRANLRLNSSEKREIRLIEIRRPRHAAR